MVVALAPCAWIRLARTSQAIFCGWNCKFDLPSILKEYNKRHLKDYRKNLRNNLTPAEAALWTLLKNKQILGLRFRRQFSVNNYILDFFCPRAKLAIELDGEVHNSPEAIEHDLKRDDFLGSLDIKVLRVENKLVFENTTQVISAIETALKEQLSDCEI